MNFGDSGLHAGAVLGTHLLGNGSSQRRSKNNSRASKSRRFSKAARAAPKATQREPNGSQVGAKVDPRGDKYTQRKCRQPQSFMYKLLINRQSGPYVNAHRQHLKSKFQAQFHENIFELLCVRHTDSGCIHESCRKVSAPSRKNMSLWRALADHVFSATCQSMQSIVRLHGFGIGGSTRRATCYGIA